MTMPLGYPLFPVEFEGERLLLENAGTSTESHRAAFGLDPFLCLHEMDNRMGTLFIELARIGPIEAADIAGKLHHSHLHAETDAEKGDAIFARVPHGLDFSLASPIAETARYQDAVGSIQHAFNSALFDIFRLDAIQFYACLVGYPPMGERFQQALVGLLQLHVFPYDGDPD